MVANAATTPSEKWYVARARHFRQEIKIRDWLTARGIEAFVPTTCSESRSAGGKRTVEKPVAPNLVFVRTDKETACSFVAEMGLPMQYIIDCATHKMMVVPDKEMEDFRRVFDLSTDRGGLLGQPLHLGDRVRITRGALRGVEGFVLELMGKTYVAVGLAGTVWAKAQVPRAWLANTQ
jgi:transcription antitermination factor NusG